MLSAMRYSLRPFNLELLWTGPGAGRSQ
jgi:hypothetical protein